MCAGRARPLRARHGGTSTSSRTRPDRSVRVPDAPGPTTLDGRYEILSRIAAGGMGEVYRARDAVLEREVAIKVLHPALAGDPGFVDRFRREARSAAGLNHPNVVHVHDWGAVDRVYFMVMEYVRGQSLRDVLNAEGILAPAQAVEVLLQVLAALDHAHRKGIVHRDVKPENVMLTPDGNAKVADFGLARAYADARSTQAGLVTGTVQYLSPEQLQGEPADPRTDLYSLGIVAYELLTGRVPFEGETQMAIAYRHVRERVPRASAHAASVPEGLDAWVASMTERDRELRPESAAEARRDLVAEAATLPSAPPVASLVRVPPDPPTGAGVGPALGAPDGLTMLPTPGPHAETVTISRVRSGRRRRRVRTVLAAVLALAAVATAAWGAWAYVVPHTVTVPNVIGVQVDAATGRMTDLGLRVTLAHGEFDKSVPRGDVLRTQPAAGAELDRDARITIVPSLGPPPVRVPDLIGKTPDQASTLLKAVHLRLGKPEPRYNEHFQAGRIVRQLAGKRAPWGSAVDVIVSKGPAPIPVPKVVGTTIDAAKTAMASWNITVKTRFSDTIPRDQVIAQQPRPGTELQPGQGVTLVVSLGPRTFAMPDVVGMSTDAATAKLKALGLRVAVTPIPGSAANTVVSTLPTAGSTVRYAQTVTIYVA
jgi:serine/threonine protein kinase/beta-lactam-binding protein with PASTA domain